MYVIELLCVFQLAHESGQRTTKREMTPFAYKEENWHCAWKPHSRGFALQSSVLCTIFNNAWACIVAVQLLLHLAICHPWLSTSSGKGNAAK